MSDDGMIRHANETRKEMHTEGKRMMTSDARNPPEHLRELVKMRGLESMEGNQ